MWEPGGGALIPAMAEGRGGAFKPGLKDAESLAGSYTVSSEKAPEGSAGPHRQVV